MENEPFEDVFPIKNMDIRLAMLVYQRECQGVYQSGLIPQAKTAMDASTKSFDAWDRWPMRQKAEVFHWGGWMSREGGEDQWLVTLTHGICIVHSPTVG